MTDETTQAPRVLRRSRPPTHNEVREATAQPTDEFVEIPDATAPVRSAEDPRSKAAARAAELREHGSVLDQNADDFYIDPAIIPDGWSYEYKRFTVLGAEDPAYQVQIAQGGWEPVPVDRHPELMPVGYRGKTILRKGMILMERPLEITQEVQDHEARKARAQVSNKEQQLGAGAAAGAFDSTNKGSPLAKIRHSHEPLIIPDK